MVVRNVFFAFILLLTGCDYYVSSDFVNGVAGDASKQTAVPIDSAGNMLGYYEYLPKEFDKKITKGMPLLFYWNGKNAISGNGGSELKGLLTQGLPEYIDQGKHYPVIIISAQMLYGDWKTLDVNDFVQYVLKRYSNHIDKRRIYMTGFSAGGGLTMRYAMEQPEVLAAIVPVAAAIRYPESNDPDKAFAEIPSWLFHNAGDTVVKPARSQDWQNVLKGKGAEHRLTIYPDEGHYAWYKAYDDQAMWSWLLKQSKPEKN